MKTLFKNFKKSWLLACIGLVLFAFSTNNAAAQCDEFADVVSVLDASGCGGCHGNAPGQGSWNYSNYAEMLTAGNCGNTIVVGSSATSLLIDKVNGDGAVACGSAMPTSNPNAANEITVTDLACLESWINAGAPELPPCNLYIAGVIDGPLGGGTPKGVQLCAANAIADLSIYGIGSANNGGGTDGEEFTFPMVALAAGECIWIASEATEFENFFGTDCTPDYVDGAANINGNDAIELFENGVVIDVFGDIATDGTGEPWEYVDGWAVATDTDCNGGTFTGTNWTFSGINALDGATDNGTAANPYPNPPTCTTVCDLVLVAGTATCVAETAGMDAYTATFTFTDADGLGAYTVTASQGTPDMLTVTNMAAGTITVTGATEGTDVILTFTDGADCDIPVTVTTPICDPTAAGCDSATDANGSIIITEIMYNPCGSDNVGEFVEICNTGVTDIDVSGWTIQENANPDGTGGSAQDVVPALTTLAAGTCYVTDAATFASNINNGGDIISIRDCEGNVVDVVDYTAAAAGGCWDGDNGISLSLGDWMNQDATTNDDMANWGPSVNAGVFPNGGTPGVPNVMGVCLDLNANITATCNGDNAEFTIDFTDGAAGITSNPITIEVYDGAALLTSTPVSTTSGIATFVIAGPTAMTTISPITVIPQGGTIDQACYDTQVDLIIPECTSTACPSTQTVDGAPASICTLGAEIDNWKADVEAGDGTGAIITAPAAPLLAFTVYSGTTGQTDYANFDPIEPSGAHSGVGCADETQTTYAYVVCDLNLDEDDDPSTTTTDVTLTEVGSIDITYFAPAQMPTIVRDDATCTYSYMEACAGDNFTPAAPTALPGEDPAAYMVEVTTANGCPAMFSVDPEACPPAACDLGVAAGTAACDAETDQADTYTATFTVTDADGTGDYTVVASVGAPDVTAISNATSTTVTVTGVTEGTDVILTVTDDNDVNCVLTATVTSPICEPAIVCSITNTVFTQACTGTEEEYNLCVSFDYVDVGASGQFNVYLDPAGVGTPSTIVAGPFNYTDYQAAIDGGAACFTVTGYTGDAADLEAGLEVCIGDADAPAPGTGLPPGSVPPPGGIPTFACPQVYGILHNACAPEGGDEGPNEFVVIVNGAEDTPVSAIAVDTPSGSDYDDFNTTAAPASWTCPCCVYLDETGTIPAGGVVVATSAANVSALDFTSLCGTAGTIYVLQDDGVGPTGHFSNGDPRTTLLNITGTTSCDGSSSYTYTNADGADGDYTTFNSPDNPPYATAGNNGVDNASTDVVNSSGDCTPQIAPVSEVECFSCTTLTEVACETCPMDIEGILGNDAMVCSDDNAVDLMVTIIGSGTGPYTIVYNDGTTDQTVMGYNDGDFITVSPTANTTYTIISITDANGCIGAESGTALITVDDPTDAGTDGTATACSDATEGNTIVDLDGALGGTPDPDGVWTETTLSGVSLATTTAVNFDGIAPGAYTFTYTVPPNGLCEGSMADVVVTVTDCETCPLDIDGVLSGDTDVCSDDTATDLMVTIGGGGMATYTIVYNDGTTDITIMGYNNGDPIPVSPTANTTYTLVSITDMNGCTGAVSGMATVTVNAAADAGTSGVANACNDATEGTSVVDLEAVLGGGQDAGGVWMDASASGADISSPTAVDFDGIPAGMYTFTYTVMGTPPCSDIVADVVVTVTDCATCPTDIAGVISGDATVCSDDTATDLFVNITGSGAGPYTLTYTDGTANIPVFNYNSGDPLPVSPSMTTTYTILSIIDVNSCTDNNVSGTATVTVNAAANAGTAGTANACDDNTEGTSVVDLAAALGGIPDAGGAWTEVTASGASLANPNAVDFNGLAVGIYTFTYTVTGAIPCADATADVVVTVTDCVVPPACTSPNVPVLTPQN